MKKRYIFISLILIFLVIIVLFNTIKVSDSAGISLEEFDKIKFGMGQTIVTSIIDSEDKWDDEKIYKKYCEEIESSNENHVYKYIYKYWGEKGGYAIITYEADYSKGDLFVLPTVTKKEQFDLK